MEFDDVLISINILDYLDLAIILFASDLLYLASITAQQYTLS